MSPVSKSRSSLSKAAGLALVLLATSAIAQTPPPTPFSDSRPPERLQGDATTVVQFTHQAGIDASCQSLFGAPPPGMKTNACFTGKKIIMPNPCAFPDSDPYAHMLCHELGHVNGWPPNHGG